MSTVCPLSITCVGGRHLSGEYSFTLKMPSDSTLADLSALILGTADFEGDRLDEFYFANSIGGQKTWLTQDDGWDADGDGEDGDASYGLRLSQIFRLPKHKKLF